MCNNKFPYNRTKIVHRFTYPENWILLYQLRKKNTHNYNIRNKLMTGNLNKWKWQRGYSKDIDILTISIEPYCDIYGQIIKTFPFWFFFLKWISSYQNIYIHSMINFQVFRIELVVRYRLKLYHNYIVLDLILMRIVLHSKVLNHHNEKLEWTSFLFTRFAYILSANIGQINLKC